VNGLILAHGGTAGAVFELVFLLIIPTGIVALIQARRKREANEEERDPDKEDE
jgi:hypothetical protein